MCIYYLVLAMHFFSELLSRVFSPQRFEQVFDDSLSVLKVLLDIRTILSIGVCSIYLVLIWL